MPTRAPKLCPVKGCGQVIPATDRYCPDHDRARRRHENASRPETDRAYHTGRWRRLRAAVLTAEPLCRMCKAKGLIRPAVLVDHIHPVRQGGPMWDPANLQPLCDACHTIKTTADASTR